jgi:hypothetical protein
MSRFGSRPVDLWTTLHVPTTRVVHRNLAPPPVRATEDAPDLGETAADIAQRAVKDDVPRQHIVENSGRRIGIGLMPPSTPTLSALTPTIEFTSPIGCSRSTMARFSNSASRGSLAH